MLSEKMKRSICAEMRSRSGGTNLVAASRARVPCAGTTWLDKRGGNGWIIRATNAWFLQRSPRSMTLFRLFPAEDAAVFFTMVLHANVFCSDVGQVMLSGVDGIIPAVEGVVLPLVCFFAMKKKPVFPPQIQIFASSRFYWLLPKKRERFIKKEIQIFFFSFQLKAHNSCTAFLRFANLQVVISAQFIGISLAFKPRVVVKCNKMAPHNASFNIQYLHLMTQTKMIMVFKRKIHTCHPFYGNYAL